MDFRQELAELLNRHSMENRSNTPDFILAKYMARCLTAFELATKERETWYGVEHYPGKSVVGMSVLPGTPREDQLPNEGTESNSGSSI